MTHEEWQRKIARALDYTLAVLIGITMAAALVVWWST